MTPSKRHQRIVIVVTPQVNALDVIGPAEVFARAGHYEVVVAAETPGPVPTSSGVQLVATQTFADTRTVDAILVAGVSGASSATPPVLSYLKHMSPHVARIGSVCVGAFALAAAGLLDGKRATTHWSACARLAEHFPRVRVDRDPIFVRSGHVYTSAGGSAGIDLALAWVEEDHGRALAWTIAREMVLFLRRPADQAQVSHLMAASPVADSALTHLQHWIAEHLDADLGARHLAKRASLSERHLLRTFVETLGVTPAKYVERARIEAARRELSSTDATLAWVAERCGFGSVDAMRRAFVRVLGTTPSDVRRVTRT